MDASTWLSWLQLLAPILLTSALTVIGGWWIFRSQKSHERNEELRRERQALYVGVFEALSSKGNEDFGLSTAKALQPHMDKLRLIAPDPVVRAALKLIKVAFEIDSSGVEKPRLGSSREVIEAYSQKSSEYAEARMNLLIEMRRDVLEGSTVPIEMTPIDKLD